MSTLEDRVENTKAGILDYGVVEPFVSDSQRAEVSLSIRNERRQGRD
jgi:hypothetical protein